MTLSEINAIVAFKRSHLFTIPPFSISIPLSLLKKPFVHLVFAIMVFISSQVALAQNCPPEDVIDGEFIVTERRQTFFNPSDVRTVSSSKLVTILGSQPRASVYLVKGKNLSDILSNSKNIVAEPNCRIRLQKDLSLRSIPNDALFLQQKRSLDLMSIQEAWALMPENALPVIVAVSDTGIDSQHEDLMNSIWNNLAEVNGLPEVDDDNNGCIDDFHGCDIPDRDGNSDPGGADYSIHGTHVAGIIGATSNNGLGTVGAAAGYVRLISAKGFSDFDEYAKLSDLISSIYYSVNNHAKVINCSWGGTGKPGQAIRDAFQFALDNDVVPVVAAGNEHQDVKFSSPASLPYLLSVGSINLNNQLSVFSNFGIGVDLVAFGGDSMNLNGFPIDGRVDEFVMSTVPMTAGGYRGLKGTSMATPFVTGVTALIRSARPDLPARQVIEILKSSGDIFSYSNRSSHSQTPPVSELTFQYPRLNAARALQMALNATKEEGGSSTKPSTSEDPTCESNSNTNNCRSPESVGPNQASSAVKEPSSGGGCRSSAAAAHSIASRELAYSGFASVILLLIPIATAFFYRRKAKGK